MEEQTKRTRGRPRKYLKEAVDLMIQGEDRTDRTGRNRLVKATTQIEIKNHCSEDTQRYFFGGRTFEEAAAGMPPKFCSKNLVMQELGRHPKEEIAGIADAIANNSALDTWTQQEIVDFLKDIRLHRGKFSDQPDMGDGIAEDGKGPSMCSLYDGMYKCSTCGVIIEPFGAKSFPQRCSFCGKKGTLQRYHPG